MPGRKHKGPRDIFTTRPHADVGKVVRARATAGGYSFSDYVSKVLAEHVGRPDLAPDPTAKPRTRQEEVLPMTG